MIPYYANGEYLVKRYYANGIGDDLRGRIGLSLRNSDRLIQLMDISKGVILKRSAIGQQDEITLEYLRKLVFFHSLVELANMSGFVRSPKDCHRGDEFKELKAEWYRIFTSNILKNPLPQQLWQHLESERQLSENIAAVRRPYFIQVLYVIGEAFLDQELREFGNGIRFGSQSSKRKHLLTILSDPERIIDALKGLGDKFETVDAKLVISFFRACERVVHISNLINHIKFHVDEDLGQASWHLQRVVFGPLGGSIADFLLKAIKSMQSASSQLKVKGGVIGTTDYLNEINALRTLIEGPHPVEPLEDIAVNSEETTTIASTEFSKLWHILNMRVDEMKFSVRTTNGLNNANIITVGQLAVKTEQELMDLRSFGEKSLNEIKTKLTELGLSLSMEFDASLLESTSEAVVQESNVKETKI